MGNVEYHDFAPAQDDSRKELDLSQNVNTKSFCMHISGNYSESCLQDLPWNIRDNVALYEKLNVSFNCLKQLPVELPFRLPHLAHLDICYNQLEEFPDSIGLLFHLREILASHNRIRTLPAHFVRLSKLRKVDLSHNDLTELPPDLGSMESLEKLNVGHNHLTCLPASLGESPTLRVLLASNNRCENQPPQSVCDQGSDMTLRFLRNLRDSKRQLPCIETQLNVFNRIRGNKVQTAVPNPDSARSQYVQVQTETMNTMSRIRTPLLPPYGATTLPPDELRDKIVGLVYGAVIGDAIGVATEFLSPDECNFHYQEDTLNYSQIIRDEHRLHWHRGDWTSNSDQMFLVIDSLLRWAGVVDELDFAERLLAWKKEGYAELGDSDGYMLSGTITMVLQDEKYIRSPHHIATKLVQSQYQNGNCNHAPSTEETFADNGSLSRSIILGIPHFHDLQEVASNSVRICRSTHAAQQCQAACVFVSLVVSLMLQNHGDPEDASSLEALFSEAAERSKIYLSDPGVVEEFEKIIQWENLESVPAMESCSHAFVPLAVAVAAVRSRLDFRSAIFKIVMQGGHSSMNGCIAGAFLGCRMGFARLPRDWLYGIRTQQQEWLLNKINLLLDMMGMP